MLNCDVCLFDHYRFILALSQFLTWRTKPAQPIKTSDVSSEREFIVIIIVVLGISAEWYWHLIGLLLSCGV